MSVDAPRVTRYTWGSGLHDQVHAEERIKSDGTRHWPECTSGIAFPSCAYFSNSYAKRDA